jgi:hypothetical protein
VSIGRRVLIPALAGTLIWAALLNRAMTEVGPRGYFKDLAEHWSYPVAWMALLLAVCYAARAIGTSGFARPIDLQTGAMAGIGPEILLSVSVALGAATPVNGAFQLLNLAVLVAQTPGRLFADIVYSEMPRWAVGLMTPEIEAVVRHLALLNLANTLFWTAAVAMLRHAFSTRARRTVAT